MHKKNKAFTLTELLVVVIVLGVLAGWRCCLWAAVRADIPARWGF